MFEKAISAALAEFDLCADGPVIVSSGKNNELDPRQADAVFMSGSNGSETAFVIPGSALKGVVRSYTEEGCSKEFADNLFGCAEGEKRKGKIAFSDAYADMDTVKTGKIFSTAIHPILQSAKNGSLNNVQAVLDGIFKARFKITNYTDDEVRAVLKALDAVNRGEVRIGGRTSRGFGKMRIDRFKMTLYGGYNDKLERQVIKTYDSFEDCVLEVCIDA